MICNKSFMIRCNCYERKNKPRGKSRTFSCYLKLSIIGYDIECLLPNFGNQINLKYRLKVFLLKDILFMLVFAFKENRSILDIKYCLCRACIGNLQV